MESQDWSHFAHDADIGVEGRGPSLAVAFEQAGLASTAVITDPGCIESRQAISIECDSTGPELLLVDWMLESRNGS